MSLSGFSQLIDTFAIPIKLWIMCVLNNDEHLRWIGFCLITISKSLQKLSDTYVDFSSRRRKLITCVTEKDMLKMFTEIYSFLSNYSYGPTSIIFCDSIGCRFARIEPYNYYLMNMEEKIYFIIPSSHGNCKDKVSCIKFTRLNSEIVCTNISIVMIHNILSRNKTHKCILSRKTDSMGVEKLINLCIEKGVLRV